MAKTNVAPIAQSETIELPPLAERVRHAITILGSVVQELEPDKVIARDARRTALTDAAALAQQVGAPKAAEALKTLLDKEAAGENPQ